MRALPYGRDVYPLDLGDRPATWLEAPTLPSPRPLAALIDEALDVPIGSRRLAQLAGPGARVTVIVSDATRDEPRAAFLAAIERQLPDRRFTIAVATGTHGPSGIASLGLPDRWRSARIVDHDGHREDDLVELGTTARGTPVRLHRCVLDADLVVATGCIRPHYFAGFGAGAKAIFPGLGHAPAIRRNHLLKQEPGARAGVVDDNPCRLDLEEAAAFVPTPVFLVNGVCGPDGAIHHVVAGDLRRAFRAGAERARPWFTVRAPRASLVIASDAPPVTDSLYQAAKIAAAMAPLVLEGGALVLVAECARGVGPLATVNDAIFRIGVLPRLARGVRIYLVSSLPRETVEQTLVTPLDAIGAVLDAHRGTVVVAPRASQLVVEAR